MNSAKTVLLKLIDEIPESQIPEVIDFIGFLKFKKDNQKLKELETASQSSMDFWNNEIDDKVWNNV